MDGITINLILTNSQILNPEIFYNSWNVLSPLIGLLSET